MSVLTEHGKAEIEDALTKAVTAITELADTTLQLTDGTRCHELIVAHNTILRQYIENVLAVEWEHAELHRVEARRQAEEGL